MPASSAVKAHAPVAVGDIEAEYCRVKRFCRDDCTGLQLHMPDDPEGAQEIAHARLPDQAASSLTSFFGAPKFTSIPSLISRAAVAARETSRAIARSSEAGIT